MNKSDLGLGCWQFGPSFGFWDGQDQLDSVHVLHKALRDNIRHFDTATSYGNGGSEQLLGHQIKRFANTIGRKDLTIATKIMPKSPSLVRKALHPLSGHPVSPLAKQYHRPPSHPRSNGSAYE